MTLVFSISHDLNPGKVAKNLHNERTFDMGHNKSTVQLQIVSNMLPSTIFNRLAKEPKALG